MKKILGTIALVVLATGALGFKYKDQVQAMGMRFTAPAVTGKINVFNPEVGEIIYDSSVAKFYGFDQNSNWVDLSNQGQTIPAGVISAFGGTTAPNGYLICDGSAVSRTTYPDLFAAIGTSFGAGDGSTTFNLPDLRGTFLRGVDGTAGKDPDKATRVAVNGGNSGNAVGSYQADALQTHTHQFPLYFQDSGSRGYPRSSNPSNLDGNYTTTGPIGANVSTETRPKNVNVNYIIKY